MVHPARAHCCRATSQIQDGGRGFFGRRSIRDDSHTIAGAISEWGVAVDWHISTYSTGDVFRHDVGNDAAVDEVNPSLALSDQVKKMRLQTGRVRCASSCTTP